ncbi:hypothetical protein GGX14DRAFT_673965 [Mycena pura]|uniref:Uncharacterized protein n=1 Tax=Mycena pura TaxID=153505 RepID=A0AAD6UW79_9AGAR|nr:hypothetical protein GGX14DRAFT_673965 [Mycena pura]
MNTAAFSASCVSIAMLTSICFLSSCGSRVVTTVFQQPASRKSRFSSSIHGPCSFVRRYSTSSTRSARARSCSYSRRTASMRRTNCAAVGRQCRLGARGCPRPPAGARARARRAGAPAAPSRSTPRPTGRGCGSAPRSRRAGRAPPACARGGGGGGGSCGARAARDEEGCVAVERALHDRRGAEQTRDRRGREEVPEGEDVRGAPEAEVKHLREVVEFRRAEGNLDAALRRATQEPLPVGKDDVARCAGDGGLDIRDNDAAALGRRALADDVEPGSETERHGGASSPGSQGPPTIGPETIALAGYGDHG